MDDRGASATPSHGGVLGYLEAKVEDVVQDFYDPRFEGRRLFSEVLGTFFLVLVAAGGEWSTPRAAGRSPLLSG